MGDDLKLIGCDFSSSPSRKKPIVVAWGHLEKSRVQLDGVIYFESLSSFFIWLCEKSSWLGGFDLPFGLPRELVENLKWPSTWPACMDYYSSLERSVIRTKFSAFCDARPVGQKFAHRATDLPAGSSPSMKWVNPPVAWMMHAGVPLLRKAGVLMPGLNYFPNQISKDGDVQQRVALEAYPGMLARELIGSKSYKSDDRLKQDTSRLIARKDLVDLLEQGQTSLDRKSVV